MSMRNLLLNRYATSSFDTAAMINLLDGLFSSFRIEGVLDSVRSLDEIVDVDAGAFAEDAPDDARHVEEERLDEQHHRNPLIVADVVLDGARLQPDRGIFGRNVVRVGYPAHLPGDVYSARLLLT